MNYFIIVLIFILLLILLVIFNKKMYTNNIDTSNSTKMYLINLDRRPDRLKTTTQLLKEYGYKNIIRFPAVDGLKLSDQQLKELVHPEAMNPIIQGKRTQHHELSRGAVGCYLSHVGIWDKCKTNESLIIFEDDTKPSLSQSELNSILSYCPDDWDIILFGGQYTVNNSFTHSKLVKVDKFYCLHAYIINYNAIQKIKPYLYPVDMQLDSLLSRIDNLNIYAIRNSDWYQNRDVSNTDIQTPVILK